MTPVRPNRRSLSHASCGAFLAAAAASAPLHEAQAGSCSERRAQLAEAAAETLPDWSAVTRYWKRFGDCEGAGLQNTLSDAIGTLLARDWGHLPFLVSEVRRQPKLRGFVLSHIDGNLPRDRAAQIRQEAAERCPRGARSLCSQIGRAAARTMGQAS